MSDPCLSPAVDQFRSIGPGAMSVCDGFTEPPDRDLPPVGPAPADHEQDRHLGEGVLPDLVADLLVPAVEFRAEAGGISRGAHLPGVAVGVAGDRGDDHLPGR